MKTYYVIRNNVTGLFYDDPAAQSTLFYACPYTAAQFRWAVSAAAHLNRTAHGDWVVVAKTENQMRAARRTTTPSRRIRRR